MPDEDNSFGGSLVLDFRKLWRHVKTIYKWLTKLFVNENWICYDFSPRDVTINSDIAKAIKISNLQLWKCKSQSKAMCNHQKD